MATSSPVRSEGFGGYGGRGFDIQSDVLEWGRIRQINITHGNLVDSITMVYANGKSIACGTDNGARNALITLEPDEFITKISGRSGQVVDQIKFTTSKNKEYGPYGGGGGKTFECNFSGKALLFIFGRAGVNIDQIGFGYGELPAMVPSSILRSTGYGGNGGAAFDDLVVQSLLGKIKSIKVRSGSAVDNIEITYDGGVKSAHGGGGGIEQTFNLGEDEWVTEIKGRSGSVLDQIQFVTNKRSSPTYGGGGGVPFSLKMDKRIVKGFFGRAGSTIDQIGVYFEEGKPLKVTILDIEYGDNQLAMMDKPPEAVQSVFLSNDTSTEQEVEQSLEISVTDTETVSISETYGTSVSVEVGVESDFVVAKATAKVTTGFTFQHQFTTETAKSNTRTETFTFRAKVPANSKIKATCVAKMAKFDIPWTATARVDYQGRPSETKKLHGTLKGVKNTSLEAMYQTVV